MATPPNDDTKMLFRILADGDWHLYDDVRDKIAISVPPGRALRKYQERIDYARRYRQEPDYDTDASEDERIYFGARACAQIVITSWKGRGVEYQGEGTMKRIRRIVGFKTWGIEHLPPDSEAQEPEKAPEVPDPTPEHSEPSEPDAAPPDGPSEPDGWAELTNPDGEATVAVQHSPQHAEEQDAEQPIDAGFMSLPPLVDTDGSAYDWSLSSRSVTSEEPPTCPDCGSLVIDLDDHRAFHARYETPPDRPEMALFAESEISDLFSGVLSKQLDDFQAGMQTWLIQQFAQLEARIQRLGSTPWRGSQRP